MRRSEGKKRSFDTGQAARLHPDEGVADGAVTAVGAQARWRAGTAGEARIEASEEGRAGGQAPRRGGAVGRSALDEDEGVNVTQLDSASLECSGDEVSRLSFEATVSRLTRLAASRGGALVAADVEADVLLAADRGTTAAAARMLAGGTEVVSESGGERGRWFPYARLIFVTGD
jgi:hypothetical protein